MHRMKARCHLHQGGTERRSFDIGHTRTSSRREHLTLETSQTQLNKQANKEKLSGEVLPTPCSVTRTPYPTAGGALLCNSIEMNAKAKVKTKVKRRQNIPLSAQSPPKKSTHSLTQPYTHKHTHAQSSPGAGRSIPTSEVNPGKCVRRPHQDV